MGTQENIYLRGITWRHTRGHLPMVATAERFAELHPEVLVQWETRSLQEFADMPIETLARRYDLLVIDHPSCGQAAAENVLLPLDEWISGDFLADQAANSVGASYASYTYTGHQWALAIDAAAPVSGWRPDALQTARAQVPGTWNELLELARRGLVILPGLAIDSLMHFYMLCSGLGEGPFRGMNNVMISEEIGTEALRMLRELLSLCDPECLSRNPIATWELLSSGGAAAYCPFAYGYSNYSRSGYGRYVLQTGGLVTLDNGHILRSTLGGAGLAISTGCKHKDVAARYAEFVADPECQSTLYFDAGGQPGHRGAWLDAEVNRRCNHFFRDTLPTLDRACLRPRFNGYLAFQDRAGSIVHRYLATGGSEKDVLRDLNGLLRNSQLEEHREHYETARRTSGS